MPYSDPLKQKEFQRKHYLKNKEIYYNRSRGDILKRRDYISNLKSKSCMDCGVKYPSYVMDFDHREGEIKIGKVSSLLNRYGWRTILEEIEKCDIVCANCHRIRTYTRKKNVLVAQRQST